MISINDAKEKLFFENFFESETPRIEKKWNYKENDGYEKLHHSIAQNISCILSTNNGLKVQDYLNKKLIFLDFGIPDILSLYQENNIEISQIEKCIIHAIGFFEPRISDVNVKFQKLNNKPYIQINGKLSLDKQTYIEIAFQNIDSV